jgi:hypothetical protein
LNKRGIGAGNEEMPKNEETLKNELINENECAAEVEQAQSTTEGEERGEFKAGTTKRFGVGGRKK